MVFGGEAGCSFVVGVVAGDVVLARAQGFRRRRAERAATENIPWPRGARVGGERERFAGSASPRFPRRLSAPRTPRHRPAAPFRVFSARLCAGSATPRLRARPGLGFSRTRADRRQLHRSSRSFCSKLGSRGAAGARRERKSDCLAEGVFLQCARQKNGSIKIPLA
jgi:hypothetical protein